MNRRARRAIAARKSGRASFTTSTVPPRVRRALLLGASGLTVALALGMAHEAAALNECGVAAGAPPSVTCKASGNPYPNGIEYQVDDLTIVVKNGVTINTTFTAGEAGGVISGDRFPDPSTVSGDLVVSVSAGVSITTDDKYADGIGAGSGDFGGSTGNVAITSAATIKTSGDWANAIGGHAYGGDVKVIARGSVSTSGWNADALFVSSNVTADHILSIESSAVIVTSGDGSTGVRADSEYNTNVDVALKSSGKITTSGKYAEGIYGSTFGVESDVSIVNSGAIITTGELSHGVRGFTDKSDSAITITSSGKITTSGLGANGILANAHGDYSDITVVSNAKITTTGEGSSGIDVFTPGADNDVTVISNAAISTAENFAHGVQVETLGEGSSISIVTNGNITTVGDYAYGAGANTVFGGAPVSIVSTGNISTSGLISFGIYGRAAFSDLSIISTGKVSTEGFLADGIYAFTGTTGNIQVTSTQPIVTTGVNADGIDAEAVGGNIVIGAGAIKTSGIGSDGIVVEADSGSATINASGVISAGWGNSAAVRVTAADPSLVAIGGAGSLGAASDVAVVDGGGALQVSNKGTITGSIDLGAGADLLTNVGTFALRDLADTNGDGTRDTEGVAFGNFGAGLDSFDNQGTLTLGKANGATVFDTAGAVADPHGTDGNLMLTNVEQGQLVGLEQFTNSGIITLQDNKTGDFLVITDQPVASPKGSGIFTSNGGELHLDVRLDDGSSGKADMLFLDVVKSGANGPTQVFVNQVGGAGGLTKGDGIEIIHVAVSSTNDAFTLGAPVVAGAFEYDLEYQNLTATDQSWYLRSSPFAGALAYPSISSSALTAWRSDLDAFEDRLDGLRLNMTAPAVTVPVMPGFADAGAVILDPARFAGGWFNMTESGDSVSQSGIAGFSQETSRAQMGFDFALDNVAGRDDWLVLGVFGGQGWSQAEFSDADANADFDVAAMGVYASYFQGPYHMDALVKFDWLDGSYSSDAVSGGGDVELPVFGVSLSTGYRFDLTTSETGGLSLQPIATLDYAHVGGDSFRDDSGATVELMEMDSLRGRLGAKLVQQLLPNEDGTGPVGSFYLSGGVAQEFLGQSEARVTGVTLTQELPQTTLELGAGFNLALPEEGVSFTFDTSADFSEGEDNYAATGGVKFTW